MLEDMKDSGHNEMATKILGKFVEIFSSSPGLQFIHYFPMVQVIVADTSINSKVVEIQLEIDVLESPGKCL